MNIPLTDIISSDDPKIRHLSLDAVCRERSTDDLREQCAQLERFRHATGNLYERVRACFFLYAIYRFHLPTRPGLPKSGSIPFEGYVHLLERRFEEAISLFRQAEERNGSSDTLSSALAAAYHRLAFRMLADQVRRSVRSVRGNQWMFRVGHPDDQPLQVRPELRERPGEDAPFPILCERTPVRMDLTHSGWSDIFFLGMDYPEGARVLNISVDLAVRGRDSATRPPVEAYFRVIDQPVLRLASVDLGATAEITSLAEVFDFARDYLGLLKAGLIASGLVPPGIEGSEQSLPYLLERLVGPGRGIELISNVNGIPKGSRLAVSTNLLAALISVCMRATRQAQSLTGPLTEPERRLVAARAILGEWIAGSGGGWQDSGGVWPGIKLIEGQTAQEGDPEYGISRGRLLPGHRIFANAPTGDDRPFATEETREAIRNSLVLVHGGMAQNVGPILEMVTEKYLLRSENEWQARLDAQGILDEIVGHLRTGDVAAIGAATTRNFFGPIRTIIPWASNLYTETVIDAVRARFGADFHGFWMLGGMSGGGMGFIFAPERKAEAQDELRSILSAAKRKLENSLPFAMEPVVYDFSINENGTVASRLDGRDAPLPAGYYAMSAPGWLRSDPRLLTSARRAELAALGRATRTRDDLGTLAQVLFDRMMPPAARESQDTRSLTELLRENGFDSVAHEQIRADLVAGRIGLAQNRLPVNAVIRDVQPGDVRDATEGIDEDLRRRGREAIAHGEVAVVTLAAGVGSRWTQGAGVVKALHPFARLAGKHRTFIETHLAKSRRVGRQYGVTIPHLFTTSYLTERAIADYLEAENHYGYGPDVRLSPGRAIGLRMVPMVRDLRFQWEETPQQTLDVQAQKMRDSVRAALMNWAATAGEGSDYTDNTPAQCLHPVGHWYEVPNLLKNGRLATLLAERPNLRYLMVHNIDTLGADVDPGILGAHIADGSSFTVEVIPRRLEDRGGGLARVDGRLRLVEGLAMPREEDEFSLTYYNSLTTWVSIDALLAVFGLDRTSLGDERRVQEGIRRIGVRMPTYVTLKEVKKRWGAGQEDVFPVAQFEKLWGDMTALAATEEAEWQVRYVAVPRLRGQQLKDQAQLDGWLRDGSAAYIETLCEWE
ncbi:MAG: UTP--glucose-1-phosphate uridylyltransferase [Capsulimonadales bacterium]|nr:UTP--glucose-1-phosphate uridylyltransferase [Capsulimonadales bacterium]